MAQVIQQVFLAAPRPIKDAFCSLYGWRTHRRRYGGGHARYLEEALRRETLTPEELQRLSLERLRETLVAAGRDVPHYRDLFRRRGIDPETLALPEGLEQIPLLSSATVREDPDRFLSDAYRGQPLETRDTSGTTGSPLAVRADLESLRRQYAIYARFRQWAGTKVGVRRATFNGRLIWPADRGRPPFCVREWSENNLLFSVYHMSPETLPWYVRTLTAYRPEEIHAYPSALLTVARFALRHGMELPEPRCIITSAETLGQADRELLESAFGCRVFDQFSNAEMTVWAGECREGRMHVDPGYSWIEILHGHDAGGVVTGDLVTTGFVNRAMPLIRYDMGDRVSLAGPGCPCGSPQPILREIVGRVDDLIVLPDGREIGRLDPVFKGLVGIREAQIVQHAPDAVTVKVAPDPGWNEEAERGLIEALAARLSAEVRIDVEKVEAIPRTARGKFRAVVNLVRRGGE